MREADRFMMEGGVSGGREGEFEYGGYGGGGGGMGMIREEAEARGRVGGVGRVNECRTGLLDGEIGAELVGVWVGGFHVLGHEESAYGVGSDGRCGCVWWSWLGWWGVHSRAPRTLMVLEGRRGSSHLNQSEKSPATNFKGAAPRCFNILLLCERLQASGCGLCRYYFVFKTKKGEKRKRNDDRYGFLESYSTPRARERLSFLTESTLDTITHACWKIRTGKRIEICNELKDNDDDVYCATTISELDFMQTLTVNYYVFVEFSCILFRHETAKGKGISHTSNDDVLKNIIPYTEEAGSTSNLSSLKLSDLKAQREKSKKKLRMQTPVQLRAQEEELAEIETKRIQHMNKMRDEYHYINFRDDALPITKFIYKWVATTTNKLGLPLPPQLTIFELPPAEKKRKRRVEVMKEVFLKEYIIVDGMHKKLTPSEGVIRSVGLVIREPKLGILSIMEVWTWSFKEKVNKDLKALKTLRRNAPFMLLLLVFRAVIQDDEEVACDDGCCSKKKT
ncbi:hypothetical protein Tco_1266391 [Tanacetum coccineum]